MIAPAGKLAACSMFCNFWKVPSERPSQNWEQGSALGLLSTTARREVEPGPLGRCTQGCKEGTAVLAAMIGLAMIVSFDAASFGTGQQGASQGPLGCQTLDG